VSKKFFRHVGAGLFGLIMLTVLAALPVCAQEEGAPRVVDEVVVQVNDQVITLSMLKREMENAKKGLQSNGATAEQAEAEVNKRQAEIILALIDEQLLIDKGKEAGLADDVEKQVNQRLLEIAKEQNFKTIEQLEEAMRAEGLDPANVRQSFRVEAMKGMVLGQEVDRKIYFGLTDTEVQQYYDAHKDKFRKPETFTLSEIFLNNVGKPDAEVLARAQKLAAQARGGADFKALAAAQSEREDQNGKRIAQETGGQAGTFTLDELDKPVVDAIKNLQKGGISDPVKVQNGYSILRVDERTPAGEPVFDANKVREAMTYERMPKERETYLTKLRQEAYIEVSATYRDALLPLLKTEAPKTASTTPAPVATTAPNKNDKKRSYAKKP
jgi:peptidyl-prolyl cis-trans isomerase SurA